MIGIISAMDIEMAFLTERLEQKQEKQIGPVTFYTGLLFEKKVVLAICGPGKVNAALCAQGMIIHFSPSKIINLGVAGGLKEDMQIGDLVIGDACVQHDFDTSPLEEPLGLIPVINKIYIPCDSLLVEKISQAAKEIHQVTCYIGTVATGDQFVADPDRKHFISTHFNAICCEMEGGAIAHTCLLYQVPFVVIRAISDGANDGASLDYPAFKEKAAVISAKLMTAYLHSEV